MASGAGCLCGAVRVAITGEPVAVRACWCRLCQYLAAGSATVNAIYRAADLAITGEVAWYASTADSGNAMRRGFCPKCGTPLFSMSEDRAEYLIVRAGALDDPGAISPESIIWTASAPHWACIDPALPHSEGQPPPLG